jgi:predicted DNA-binding transcriptional regulator YafY
VVSPCFLPAVDPAVQATVVQAVFEGKRLAITYTPHGVPEPKEYEVNPIALVQRDHLLYIVCTLWDYQNPMLLVMHRIRFAVTIEKASSSPMGFDLDDYILQGGLGYRVGPPITLIAELDPSIAAILRETPLSSDQILSSMGTEAIQLTASVADTKELRAWLRGFGHLIRVLEPPGLLDQI